MFTTTMLITYIKEPPFFSTSQLWSLLHEY